MPPISHRALIDATEAPGLTEQFLVPPFSVLDARQGYWQQRKRRWLNLGIQSELGRGENNVPNGSVRPSPDAVAGRRTNATVPGGAGAVSAVDGASAWSGERGGKRANATPGGSPPEAVTRGADGRTVRGDGRGRPLAETFGSGRPGDMARAFKGPVTGPASEARRYAGPRDDAARVGPGEEQHLSNGSGTSIFDPVLCELAYRWWCPPGGVVLDPFAGGSVRGVVAAACSLRYYGIDLSERQILANREQWQMIAPRLADRASTPPRWAVGDSRAVLAQANLPPADLVFTCPPYGDLELYSNDPRDLSTLDYDGFMTGIEDVLRLTRERLNRDRFAVWVVGDYRDRKTGFYRGFPADLICAADRQGLELYNDAVLLTSVGSLPLRVGNQFRASRKLGKGHQNILVFVYGDPRRAAEACGAVDAGDEEALALAGWAGEDCIDSVDDVE